LTLNIADNRDLDVSGTMSIHVTGPTSGYLIVAPTSYDIYEIRDISAKGSGVDCRMMGYINGDAEIVFLSPLVNSYDTKTESFISFLSISGWSTQDFRNNVISGHPACTEQVNEEGLTYEIQNFFDGISKISSLRFQVGYSGKNMLAGVVSLEGYEKSVQLPGGWWQRTTSGSWTVFKEPAKPKGWKK
jgi:hypothetical protein